jgi:hypothetical protein
MTRPALADVLAAVCCDTHCAGWWRAEIAAGMRVGCDSRGASTPTATVPWSHATTADALDVLDARGLIPTHWSDPVRGPWWWWCPSCAGHGRLVRTATYAGGPCPACRGDATAPPSLPALVAVASLGVDALARAEEVVAETWRARVVFRVMTAEALDAHGEWTFSRAYAPGESHAPRAAAIERHTGRHLRSEVPEACDHGDQHPSVVAAWPALRALAALGLHLVAVDDGRVTLAVEAP